MKRGRRSFIRIAGSAAVIAAAGGGVFAMTREPRRALAPWRRAGTSTADPRVRALSYAILAPNPHNRQPWLVDLSTPDEAVLLCDRERLLPQTDPFERQIVIGLGCFLELLRMAGAAAGLAVESTPFPDGEPGPRLDDRPVARVRFRRDPGVRPDPLFAQVLSRRTNKEPFDVDRPVAGDVLAAIAEAAHGRADVRTGSDEPLLDDLRALTWEAFETEVRTPRTYLESVRLMRIGKREIERSPDGIDLGGPLLETLALLGQLDREQLADPASTAFRQGLEMYRPITATAMAYLWVVTGANARADQLEAGRAYVRANLAATARGVGMHPLSQALQEYPEMDGLRAALDRRLAVAAPARLQMLARLGYGPEVAPSPRWPVATRIVGA